MEAQALVEKVLTLAPGLEEMTEGSDCACVKVPVAQLASVALALRDTAGLDFDHLADHTSIDWMEQDEIELIYQLYSMQHGHKLRLSCRLQRKQPVAPSLYKVWDIAEWQEREVYDLMGVQYADHPDLRRLFLDDDWEGYPLRKDYTDDFMLKP